MGIILYGGLLYLGMTDEEFEEKIQTVKGLAALEA